MADVVVKARIEPELKENASLVLKKMGISMSDAIRLFLSNVAAEKALPFTVKVPNETTLAAVRACEAGELEDFDSLDDMLDT